MNKNKVIRRSLKVNPKAKFLTFERALDWVVKIENGKTIDAFSLRHIDGGERILSEFNIFLRKFRKSAPYAYSIMEYLNFVAKVRGLVSSVSLSSFKDYIDREKSVELNTKADGFGKVKQFLNHLMSAAVIKQEHLPPNFERAIQTPKSTFAEIASRDLAAFETIIENYTEEIYEFKESFSLDSSSASFGFFCDYSMKVIHRKSLSDVRQALQDIAFCDQAIACVSNSRLQELKAIENFSIAFNDNRTVDEAFAILYVNYGVVLPPVEQWIPGVYDFLKMRGWKSPEIRYELALLKASEEQNIHRIVSALSLKDITYYKGIKDWRLKYINKKSVELAFQILFAKYGRCLPTAKEWPKGLGDYCKSKGWGHKRVYSAFFPDKQIQQPLLLAFLSHNELAPNVDSVFYYAYLDTISKSYDTSKARVFLGKYRGAPVDKDLCKEDPLISVVSEYIKRYKSLLSLFKEGQVFLKQESVSIFGHIFRGGTRQRSDIDVRLYDPSTPSDWIQPAITRYAKKEPILLPLAYSRITGESFRPTHAVIDTFKGVNQGLIKQKLNHAFSSTTNSYTTRVATASTIQSKHKKFQSFIVEQSRLPKKSETMAMDSDLAPGNIQELKCTKRIIFSDINLVAEWVAYHDKINKEKERLILNNPRRWRNYWEVKLAEYEALISKVGSRDYVKAKEIASNLELPHLD